MGNALDKAVRAQCGAVVKPHQVKAMILAARRAYVKLKSEEVEEWKGGKYHSTIPPFHYSTLPSFDVWRRATLHDIVGAAAPSSFRAVTQRDYAAVVRYFLALAGEEVEKVEKLGSLGAGAEARNPEIGEARNPEIPNSSTSQLPNSSTSQLIHADERRRALWTLNLVEGEVAEEFGGRGEARKYADALFWKIHKTDRTTATARQIWAVIFTLRKRASARRAKTAIGARGAKAVPSSPPEGSERFPAFSRGL